MNGEGTAITILLSLAMIIVLFTVGSIGSIMHKQNAIERAKVMDKFQNETVRKIICGSDKCENYVKEDE